MPALFSYLIHLADNALILGHRNSEWCGHGPVLEQDIALTNISLDLIGQARYFYQYAAELKGGGATEDSLAYLREDRELRNFLMLELPKGHWGVTVMRQFLYSQYQFLLYRHLLNSADKRIAAIAEKALKETTYHLRWSSEWVIRLGDGTPESQEKMQDALALLWNYTGEFFVADDTDRQMTAAGIAPLPENLQQSWVEAVDSVLREANLATPANNWQHQGGKSGAHTEHLGFILAEMQYLQRAYPGSIW